MLYEHQDLEGDRNRIAKNFSYCLGCHRGESSFVLRSSFRPLKTDIPYGNLPRLICTCVYCGSSAIFMLRNGGCYRLSPGRQLRRLDSMKPLGVRAPDVELPRDWFQHLLEVE